MGALFPAPLVKEVTVFLKESTFWGGYYLPIPGGIANFPNILHSSPPPAGSTGFRLQAEANRKTNRERRQEMQNEGPYTGRLALWKQH